MRSQLVALCLVREKSAELRDVQSRRLEQQVCAERVAQLGIRQQQLQQNQREEKLFHDLWVADCQAKEELERQLVTRQQQRNVEQLNVLKQQLEAAELRRQPDKLLQQEEAQLQVCICANHVSSPVHTVTNQPDTVDTMRACVRVYLNKQQQQQEMQQLQEQRQQHHKLQAQRTRRRQLDQSLRLKMERVAREQQDDLRLDNSILQQLLKDETDQEQEGAQRKVSIRHISFMF